MKLEISTFKITKDKVTIELTAEEAKELFDKLSSHFTATINMPSALGYGAFNEPGLITTTGSCPVTPTSTTIV